MSVVFQATGGRRVVKSEHGVQICLLGGLKLVRAGQPISLPPSKKTRALLVYLVATGRRHMRERLCDLFWDGPDDPENPRK